MGSTMSDENPQHQQPHDASDEEAACDARRERESGGRRILKFVVTFVVLVLAFLTGYRYAMNTETNMRYLFMVASHTTWVLSLVGDDAELEPFRAPSAAAKRAELAEWRGKQAGTASEEPLTPLESWLHKAYSKIRNADSIQDDGPTVRFVAEEGLDAKRRRIEKEIRRLALEGDEHASRIETLEAKLKAIEKQEEAISPGPERVQAKRGLQFSFRVVPDCGAIPSMSIFLAAVLAFPTRWWKRIVGAAAGLFVLYWINVLRLATLAYIGAIDSASDGKWFTFVHEYLWQGVFIIFVVAVWMAWIEFVVRLRRT